MGYCYEMRNGRRRLCCDVCGEADGTVRKVACKYGYCPATAMCAGCRKNPGVKAKDRAYHEANCKEAAAEFAAREARKDEVLALGGLLRCAAVNEGDDVRVYFRDLNGDTVERLMSPETYRAFGLLDVATLADYERVGEVRAG